MKYLIVSLFILVFNSIGFAQSLTGYVFDLSNLTPLDYVSVVVERTGIGTVSDASGLFEIGGSINDNDVLIFSHIGYKSSRRTVREIHLTSMRVYLESKILTSQTILITGNIGITGITPLTFSKINRTLIKETYITQDIPELLSYQPSITFYSENGNGLGYNYLSIRGFDQRRISVSVNGIPQNDPEDHNVYWLDFPDLLESTEMIQVQRGAGSGIVGYPAVGGSINIITSSFSDRPRLNFSTSLGGYNTRKYSAQFSSGLISNKYSFYSKLSQTLSSGYRNNSWIDFKSFHFSAIRFDESITTQINIYGGPISDGLAYTGLPKFAIKDREMRKGNHSYWEADDKNYTYVLERRREEMENFSQPHFEFLNEIKLSDSIIINNALFLILGEGFFDYDGSWADSNYFRINNEFGFHPSANPGNSMIRAMVQNKQWGWIPRISIKHDKGELILGGEFRIHRSLHWGSINFGVNLPEGLTKDYRYYEYKAGNDIVNFYAHEKYRVDSKLNLLIEGQFAYHNYRLFDEKYVGHEFMVGDLFFNPRIGINYQSSPGFNIYLSLARITREPRLKNYYDAAESSGGSIPQFELTSAGIYNFSKPLVRPETMNNIELGSTFVQEDLSLSANLYYMLFNDEIVKQGQIDRFGQPVTGNMDQTIHYGIEVSGSYKPSDQFEFIINSSASRNYISSGYTYIPNAIESTPGKVDLVANRISGFPDLTFNLLTKYRYKNLFLQFSVKLVGEFYTDNYDAGLKELKIKYPAITDYSDNKVDSYIVANLFTSYSVNLNPIGKDLQIFCQVNNLFDNLYASYGIGKEYFPAADRNFTLGINLSL